MVFILRNYQIVVGRDRKQPVEGDAPKVANVTSTASNKQDDKTDIR
jgi:hypothetical protein